MSYIGLDIWDKRVGLAISRENIAFAQTTIARVELISHLKNILWNNSSIEAIIVGLPYDLYGVDTKQLEKTKKIIQKLEETFPNIAIIGHDERFSSFEAALVDNMNHRDDIAAQCILQSFLDAKLK